MSDRRTTDGLYDALGAKDSVTVYSSDGKTIGKAGQVYLDDVTGKPEWVSVHTGTFGTKESFIPIAAADLDEDGLQVPFDQDMVKSAPTVDAQDGHLSQADQAELYEHYGMEHAELPLERVRLVVGTVTDAQQIVEELTGERRQYVVTEQPVQKGSGRASRSESPEESRTAWAEAHVDELATFRSELTARKAELAGVDGI